MPNSDPKEALQRIRKAKQEGATRLSLDKLGLTVLPEALRNLTKLEVLSLRENQFEALPDWIGSFTNLRELDVTSNCLTTLPESIGSLTELQDLFLAGNQLKELPDSIGNLAALRTLIVTNNHIRRLPSGLRRLRELDYLCLGYQSGGNPIEALPDFSDAFPKLRDLTARKCGIVSLPPSIASLPNLHVLDIHDNPLEPELAAAYAEGLDAVKGYLRAMAGTQVVLNEAKLILIGEGEVGKSSLLAALRGDAWEEGRPTTHGIEIKPIVVTDPATGTQITLNGWDFGGQRVYRPTHQLFFSAPAIYLVVWKPREGPQQGFVKEWIKLVKHREPEAMVLVVATHGGPKERQPDIDRQELWDLFGRDTVRDFFFVDSKPDPLTGERKGVAELKEAIACLAISLPEVGRKVPKRWEAARQALHDSGAAYLPLEQVLQVCAKQGMSPDEASDFVRISHRLGHLIHYAHDPLLRDIVILKPDWLSTAISFVLDDKQTRESYGLVSFPRLSHLWNDESRDEASRYEPKLHPLFLRLMERFDLSYKVTLGSEPESAIAFWQRVGENCDDEALVHYMSLIAQLVPDIRPNPLPHWDDGLTAGDEQQSQICRIVEMKSGQSAAAEGLFYQLIVRLHKYSLGRVNYANSVHWQRGLLLEDDYGAHALLEHAGNDVRITVRSPYPERFLSALTYDVKWLVEHFWAGLRCDVMVPCLNPEPCSGLFDVTKLIENKRRGRPEQPCPICNEWESIELLLHNAPAARPNPLHDLLSRPDEVMAMLREIRKQLTDDHQVTMGRFDKLDASSKELVTKVDAAFAGLMRMLIDEAKDGPRLFSFEPVTPGFFDRPNWISEKFQLTLWCEHSRLPLPVLYGDARGKYELSLPRDWVVAAAPFLKLLAHTLSLVVPVAAAATKLVVDEVAYKGIEKELELGQRSVESLIKGGELAGEWLAENDAKLFDQVKATWAHGAVIRQLHAWLKEKDPGFGGLVRVQNKRQEFLWVHPQFEKEY